MISQSNDQSGSDSEFRAWRKSRLVRLRILCAAGCLVGIIFINHDPATTLIVSGLGVLGVITTTAKLARIDGK